jgi:hypothetical protein
MARCLLEQWQQLCKLRLLLLLLLQQLLQSTAPGLLADGWQQLLQQL